MTRRLLVLCTSLCAIALIAPASPAQAQSTRGYVGGGSGSGNPDRFKPCFGWANQAMCKGRNIRYDKRSGTCVCY